MGKTFVSEPIITRWQFIWSCFWICVSTFGSTSYSVHWSERPKFSRDITANHLQTWNLNDLLLEWQQDRLQQQFFCPWSLSRQKLNLDRSQIWPSRRILFIKRRDCVDFGKDFFQL